MWPFPFLCLYMKEGTKAQATLPYPFPALYQHCNSGDSPDSSIASLHDPYKVLEKQGAAYWLPYASCPGERAAGQGHDFYAWPLVGGHRKQEC